MLYNPASARLSSSMSPRRILFIGYGAIAQAFTPLLFRLYPDLSPAHVGAITADARGAEVARDFGIRFEVEPITAANLETVLAGRLAPGDLMLNLSVEVSTLALIDWCQRHGVLYLDTCVEPWAGGYDRSTYPLLETTNYRLRRQALQRKGKGKPTCVVAHGANPGLVSHFVKLALRELAARDGLDPDAPPAALARALGVKAIQIAERDTQTDGIPLADGEFANTWSADGLMAEAMQAAELAWGTHEMAMPPGARRHDGSDAAGLILGTAGVASRVASWVPSAGAQQAWLLTHHEALAIGEYLTEFNDFGAVTYRPTVYYAYRPAPKTCDSLARWRQAGLTAPRIETLMRDALTDGVDELGVLLVRSGGSYWFGSRLSLEEARRIAPCNNATSMQVVGGIAGAIAWMLRHPFEGVVEAEDMDAACVMEAARPFLGALFGVETDWPGIEKSGVQTADFLERE
jgi:homospermidine synthase